jgi:dienelactone hydrolase
VALTLRNLGLGTLLFDLLTEEEDRMYENRFDIPLLTERLVTATEWIHRRPDTGALPIGYFGASTGSAAALRAAARLKTLIAAVVSRGGRPDLAGDILPSVAPPTLLIVGGDDTEAIELNESAYDMLVCPKRLEIVPGATHLFEEPGALERVAQLAAGWFQAHLAADARV